MNLATRRAFIADIDRRVRMLARRRPAAQASGGGTGDADTLDGIDSTGFALAGHTHAGVYSPVGHTHTGVYAPATIPEYTVAGRPAAAVGNVGTWIRVKDAVEPTQVQVCCQNSGGGYEWVTVGQSS